MKRIALLLFLFALPALGQTPLERCQQNACFGYGPPTGICSGDYKYADVTQTPMPLYACRQGAWVAAAGRAALPSGTGLVKTTAGAGSIAGADDIQTLIQAQAGCSTAGNAWNPATNTCAPASGGGGVPGGANQDIQINQANVFGVDTGVFTYNKTSHMLGVQNVNQTGSLNINTTNPTSGTTITVNELFNDSHNLNPGSFTRSASFGGPGGFNFGNGPNVTRQAWTFGNMNYWNTQFNRRGITQFLAGGANKNATGDFGLQYFNDGACVGGNTGASDEGCVLFRVRGGGEVQNVYTGTVGVGASPGATTIPASNGNTTCDGCFVADTQTPVASGHFTGAPVAVTNPNPPYNLLYYVEPIDTPVTPSTAYSQLVCGTNFTGTINDQSALITNVSNISGVVLGMTVTYGNFFRPNSTITAIDPVAHTITITQGTYGTAPGVTIFATNEIPQSADQTAPQPVTCTATGLHGTTGAFTTGLASLSGGFSEQVNVTAVGAVVGGQQSVTFTHRNPGVSYQDMLWQGGPQGTIQDHPYLHTLSGLPQGEMVFGATDSTHLVSMVNVVGSQGPSQTGTFLPSEASGVINITKSGTTVTAFVAQPPYFNGGRNGASVLNGLAAAVISGCSDAGINGTLTNLRYNNGTSILTGTEAAGGSGCGAASISLPPYYAAFALYPYAEQIAADTPGSIAVEPNSMPLTAGDALTQYHPPTFAGEDFWVDQTILNPNGGTNSAGVLLTFTGAGISGTHRPFVMLNHNPCGLYVGCGGLLDAPQWITLTGQDEGIINASLPLTGKAAFLLDCPASGCGNPVHLFQLEDSGGTSGFEGDLSYIPTTQTWDFGGPAVSGKVSAATVTSPVLTTGSVALTSSIEPLLGPYGMFGTGAPSDTSANMGAASLYAGSINAGATSPSGAYIFQPGATGSTTYSYVATSATQNGESAPSVELTTFMGYAALGGSNVNGVKFIPGYGAQSVNVFRVAGPGGVGEICHAVPNYLIDNSTPGCFDTGQAAGRAVPTTDTSGKLMQDGKNVCLADGTNCPSGSGGSSFITGLTTTGSGGPATVSSGILNVPQYAGGTGGGNTTSTSLTSGTLPMANGTNSIVNSHLDDGVTAAGVITSTEPIAVQGLTVNSGANNVSAVVTSASPSNTAILLTNTSTGGHSWADLTSGSAVNTSYAGNRCWLDVTSNIIPFCISTTSTTANMSLPSGFAFSWLNMPGGESGTADLGLSRSAAGVLSVDEGTPGDGLGTLKAAGIALTGTGTYMGTGSAANTDLTGELSFAAATTATYTFAKTTLTNHSECIVTPQATTASSGTPFITYTAATSFTINFPTAFTGAVSYVCIGRN